MCSRLPVGRMRLLAVAVTGALACGAMPVRAETLVAVTQQGLLIRFDSQTPILVTSIGAITGLAPGDALTGRDHRLSLGPDNGVHYGPGSTAGPTPRSPAFRRTPEAARRCTSIRSPARPLRDSLADPEGSLIQTDSLPVPVALTFVRIALFTAGYSRVFGKPSEDAYA